MRFKATRASQLAAIGTWLLISTPASSQDYARDGFYAGAGVLGGSYTKIDDELEDALAALGYVASIDTETAVGFELYGGYRFHPNFAIEAEFEMLPKADIDLSGFGTFAELETWTLTGNMKAFALTGRIQPYALVGIGVMHVEVDDTVGLGISETEAGFAARFGGGLDFYITENIAVSVGVDYLLPTGDVEDLDYVSFGGGIQYRF
ncbi:MAG: porin family protein [Gemmatimonadota bacterium]